MRRGAETTVEPAGTSDSDAAGRPRAAERAGLGQRETPGPAGGDSKAAVASSQLVRLSIGYST